MLCFLSKPVAAFSPTHRHGHTDTHGHGTGRVEIKEKHKVRKQKQKQKQQLQRQRNHNRDHYQLHAQRATEEDGREAGGVVLLEGDASSEREADGVKSNTRKRKGNTHEIAIYIKFICTHMHAHTHRHTRTRTRTHMHAQIKFIHTHNETTLAGT